MSYVLDASAVLAFLNEESGSDIVGERLPDAIISAVNVIEVGTRLVDRGMSADDAHEIWAALDLSVRAFNETAARLCIDLRRDTRGHGLSLGDRACLALALQEQAVAVTADRIWADLNIGCDIELIR